MLITRPVHNATLAYIFIDSVESSYKGISNHGMEYNIGVNEYVQKGKVYLYHWPRNRNLERFKANFSFTAVEIPVNFGGDDYSIHKYLVTTQHIIYESSHLVALDIIILTITDSQNRWIYSIW